MKKFLFITIALIFFATAALLVHDHRGEEELGLHTIMPAPDSIVKHFSPKEELYIVVFFASWCKSCVAEHDNIMKIHDATNIPIYGIALNDFRENILRMLHGKNPYKEISLNFPISKLSEITIERIPRMLIIYKENVIYDYTGGVNSRILYKEIMPLLDEVASVQGS